MELFKQTLLQYQWLGVTALDYIQAVVIFFVTLIILKTFQLIILARLKKLAKSTSNDIDDAFVNVFSHIRPVFYFVVSMYIGLRFLPLSQAVWKPINIATALVVAESIIRAFSYLMDLLVHQYLLRRFGESTARDKLHTKAMIRMMRFFVVVTLWIVVLLLLAANAGINVSSMIASLGIGGIAIALAVQNVLTDIFSSFSILIDKPFEVGDYIEIGEDSGTVQKIGMKTTRLKTLRGEELVVSNKELTTIRIQNFKDLDRRREAMHIGVVYETSIEKLKKIPSIVSAIVQPIENVDFDRCHLKTLDASALTYEIVVFINTDKFEEYMDLKQNINLGLLEEFKKEGIAFAYPTTTVYSKK